MTDTIGAGSLDEESVHQVNARLRYSWLEAVMDGNIARDTGDLAAAEAADARRDLIQNEFFASNRRLAMSAAQSFLRHARGEDLYDHEQAALLGLWEAFAGTDPVKGRTVSFDDEGRFVAKAGWDPAKSTFGTFCRSHVQGKVRRSVASVESGLSYANWTDRPQVMDARARLIERGISSPTVRQVAAEAKMAYDKVDAILTPNATSLQTPVGSDGATLGDLIADQSGGGDNLDETFSGVLLRTAAASMEPVPLFTYMLRKGLLGRSPLSLVDTADRLGLGRGAVASAEKSAVKQIDAVLPQIAFGLPVLGLLRSNPKVVWDLMRAGKLLPTT